MSPLKRITSILLVSTLLALILIVLFLGYSLRESAVNQWADSRSQAVRQLSLVVDDELAEALEKLEFVIDSDAFRPPLDPTLIDLNVNGIPLGTDTRRRAILDAIMEGRSHGFNVVFVLLPNGDHYISHPYSVQQSLKTYNLSHRPYFQEATKTRKPIISNRFLGADGMPAVALDVPVLNDDGEIIYHLGGVFHLVRAGRLMEKNFFNDYNESIFLLDGTGQVITHSGTLDPKVAKELFYDSSGKPAHQTGDMEFPEDSPVSAKILTDPASGKSKIYIMTRVECGWTLGMAADFDGVTAEFQPQVIRTAIFAGIILLIISGIAFLLVHRIGRGWQISDELIESALRERENLFDAITNQSVEGITVADTDGKYTFVNPAFCKMMGYSAEELLQMTVFDVKAESQDTTSFARSKSSKEGLPIQVYLKRKDGSEFFSEVLGKMIEIGGEKAVLGTVRDITERMQHDEERLNLERQMQHAQKLESLGVLAGGIAHDFNNLLMAILGNADLALANLSPMSPARENLIEIENASRRAAELARQMLAYSGKGRFVVEPIHLGELVREIAHLLEVSISKKVDLRYNLFDDLPTFNGDVTQIRQIVMNLITNASESIGEQAGVVTLSTGIMDCDREYLDNANTTLSGGVDAPLPEGFYAYLEVTDTGCGMNLETIAKVFDPFFTTKFTGRGLGMSAVLGIVRGHHGAIMVYSEVGKGTTFKILFKANMGGNEKPVYFSNALGQTDDSEFSFSGTVLVVDDEAIVCSVGKQMLLRMGFNVLTAADGREGVKVYEANQEKIVCILLDLTMPDMDGEEAFREFRRINSGVKVILCSGYNEVDATQNFAGKGLAGFIQKPYNLKMLRSKLVDVLSG